VQFSRDKCGRPHLSRYVVFAQVWRRLEMPIRFRGLRWLKAT
jgi:hypothetical protein